ncbi:MAG: hypothetical protein EKK57_09670 [Proteobacteria bacterium]|nr:MAG: hypothetical protein EKK57_09670 [Pseudomonadota bacterium]
MHRYFTILATPHINFNQRVLVTPTKPRFHNNWEWRYDFPEIKQKFYQLFIFFYKKVLLFLVSKARLEDFACHYEPHMTQVDTEDIEDFIFKNLRDNQKISYLYTNKSTIIFGPDIRPKLMKVVNSFQFSGNFRFQANIQGENILFFYEIPMIYLPTISGIHIVPDLTGKWSESLQRVEPTSYAKLRRY